MKPSISLATIFALFLAVKPATAESPTVVADIAPIHSLTAMVMDGIGEPVLLVPPSASPHGYALRPSQVRSLSDADLVVWMGPGLEPWLDSALDTVATDAQVVNLNELPGIELLPNREAPGAHDDHGDDGHEEGHDEHADGDGHEDHAEHDGHEDHGDDDGHDDHAEGEGHDDHAEGEGHDDHAGHDGHDHHDHGENDPHTWLDPMNAQLWLDAIAATLAEIDPDHAQQYRDNAAKAKATIAAADKEIMQLLNANDLPGYVVWHDAYQYFEHHYGIEAAASVSRGDGTGATAARVSKITAQMDEGLVGCVASEPQFSDELSDMLASRGETAAIVMDPLGQSLTPGPELYVNLLTDLADALASCGTAG